MKNKNINKGSGTQINIGKNTGVFINGTNDNSPKQVDGFWDRIMKLPLSIKLIGTFLIILLVVLLFVLLNKGFTIETPLIKVTPPKKDSISLIENKNYRPEVQTQIETKKPNDMDFFKKKNTDRLVILIQAVVHR